MKGGLHAAMLLADEDEEERAWACCPAPVQLSELLSVKLDEEERMESN